MRPGRVLRERVPDLDLVLSVASRFADGVS